MRSIKSWAHNAARVHVVGIFNGWELYKFLIIAREGKYRLKLNSDEQRFGGGGNWIPQELDAFWDHEYGHFSVCLNLPPYAACVYLF